MILCKQVTKTYRSGDSPILALNAISLSIAEREFVAICGPSGCGKSTLLHILGGLDQPDHGEVLVNGFPLHSASEKELTLYRRKHIGFVFQFFNLLPTMTVVENVEMPLLLAGEPAPSARKRALDAIEAVGLQYRISHFPHQLSGGQMQRVAIARAIVHRPPLLLADEPTGNLDSATSAQILDVLLHAAQLGNATLILVTHSDEIAARASRRIHLRDGKILSP